MHLKTFCFVSVHLLTFILTISIKNESYVLAVEIWDNFLVENHVNVLPIRNSSSGHSFNSDRAPLHLFRYTRASGLNGTNDIDDSWSHETMLMKKNLTEEMKNLYMVLNELSKNVTRDTEEIGTSINKLKEVIACKAFEENHISERSFVFFKYSSTQNQIENIIVLHNSNATCKKDPNQENVRKCCDGIDSNNHNWNICENEIVQRHCETPNIADSSLSCFESLTHECNCNFTVREILPLKQMQMQYSSIGASKTLNDLKTIVESGQKESRETSTVQLNGDGIELIAQIAASVPLSRVDNSSYQDIKNLTQESVDIITKLIVTKERWELLQPGERPQVFTNVMSNLESLSTALNKAQENENGIANDTLNTIVSSDNILIGIGTNIIQPGTDTSLFFIDHEPHQQSHITVTIPQKVAQSVRQSDNNSTQTFGFFAAAIPSEFVEDNLKEQNVSAENQTRRGLNSKVISFNITGHNFSDLGGDYVQIVFKNNVKSLGNAKHVFARRLHQGEKGDMFGPICSFWDTTELKWSTEGCDINSSMSTPTTTICVCNHLTTFAVLAGYHDYDGKDELLKLITWILCPISAFCLLATLVTFICLQNIIKDQRIMTIHLSGTLICGNLLLLISDKDNFHLSDALCTTFGIATHYVWLCAFGWMACQGVQLYAKVILVFNTSHNLQKFYSLGSYGIPLIIVGLTAAVGFSVEEESVYVGKMFCWLRGPYIWFFMGPVIIILVGNLIILVWVMIIVRSKSKQQNLKSTRKQKSNNAKLIRATLTLSMLLGLTWFVGFFSMIDFPESVYLAHIFTVLNASQGIFIFIFHCCMNETLLPHITKLWNDCLSRATWLKTTTTSTTNATNTTNASNNSSKPLNSISEMADLPVSSSISEGSIIKRKPFFQPSNQEQTACLERKGSGEYNTFSSQPVNFDEMESTFDNEDVINNTMREDLDTDFLVDEMPHTSVRDDTEDVAYGFGRNVQEVTSEDAPSNTKSQKSGFSVSELKKRLVMERISMKKGKLKKGALADDHVCKFK